MAVLLSRVLMTLIVLVVQAIMLLWLGRRLGVQVDTPMTALATATLVALLNFVFWPLLLRVLERLNLIVFVVLSLLLTGSSVLVASYFLPGFQVTSLGQAFLVALLLALATTIVTTIFGFHDADYYTRWLMRRLQRFGVSIYRRDAETLLGRGDIALRACEFRHASISELTEPARKRGPELVIGRN